MRPSNKEYDEMTKRVSPPSSKIFSMIYKKAPLEELPDILADGKRRAAGKYIITV